MSLLGLIMLMLVALLGLGVWVGFALLISGAATLALFTDIPVIKLAAFDLWQNLNSPELAALPLFVLMGEVLFRSGLSNDLFRGLAPWMQRVPGRLLHVNVLGCTLFAAVSGSSAATTATVGRITLKELETRGYDKALAMGSLCGAGTLGFLIPPSIILILYGVLAEVSILNLFIGGLVPGLLLAGSYMSYIAVRAGFKPELAPIEESAVAADWRTATRLIAPIIGLIGLVLGSMYGGIASPTEAAILGVVGALIIVATRTDDIWATYRDAFMGAIRTISMIGLIVAGALFLTRALAFLGIPAEIAASIGALNLTPIMLIVLLLVFYALLGMILDGLSVIVMTLPVVLPLVMAAGFDLVWFGIFLVIVVEMAQVTPPVGFNLFVVKELTGEPISRIARAALPFFAIMAAFAMLITLFPGLVTFLPDLLG